MSRSVPVTSPLCRSASVSLSSGKLENNGFATIELIRAKSRKGDIRMSPMTLWFQAGSINWTAE